LKKNILVRVEIRTKNKIKNDPFIMIFWKKYGKNMWLLCIGNIIFLTNLHDMWIMISIYHKGLKKGVIICKNTILQLFTCIHFAKICFHRILVIFAMTCFQLWRHSKAVSATKYESNLPFLRSIFQLWRHCANKYQNND
jgi:hypothetical protein